MTIPSQDLQKRICITCKVPKLIGDFYRRSGSQSHQPSSECKLCTRERTKARYLRDKETIKPIENAKKRRKGALLKDRVFLMYGGWICACCGESEKLFLTLDHINNDGAEFRRMLTGDQSRGGGQITYRWLEKNHFPLGFQVLCSNCQHGKRMNKGVCPHEVRRRDQSKDVDSSESKRATALAADDMIRPTAKAVAVGSWSDNEVWPLTPKRAQ